MRSSPFFYLFSLLQLAAIAWIAGIISLQVNQLHTNTKELSVDPSRFSPPTRLFLQTGTSKVIISLDTGGAAVRKLESSLTYPPERIKVKTIGTLGTSCTVVSDQNINQTEGIVNFGCDIARSSLKSQLTQLAAIEYEVLQSGPATICFDPKTTHAYAGNIEQGDILQSLSCTQLILTK